MIAAPRVGGGQISLLADVGDDGRRWRERLDAFVDLLLLLGQHIEYAYVRRDAYSPASTAAEQFVWGLWPSREQPTPKGSWYTPEAFEEHWVPDIFGVQLLGRRLARRLPEAAGWRATPVGDGVLLSSEDAEAWFAEPFIKPPRNWRETPDVPRFSLTHARPSIPCCTSRASKPKSRGRGRHPTR